MIISMATKIATSGGTIQYLEDEKNAAPTIITRFPGYDIFLLGVGPNLYVYALEKNFRLKQIQKYEGVITGVMSDMCIKGNTVYMKGSQENALKIIVFGASPSRGLAVPDVERFSKRLVRHHPVNFGGNLEKIWLDEYNNIIYCGGGLGITGLKKDKLSGQLVQIRTEVWLKLYRA